MGCVAQTQLPRNTCSILDIAGNGLRFTRQSWIAVDGSSRDCCLRSNCGRVPERIKPLSLSFDLSPRETTQPPHTFGLRISLLQFHGSRRQRCCSRYDTRRRSSVARRDAYIAPSHFLVPSVEPLERAITSTHHNVLEALRNDGASIRQASERGGKDGLSTRRREREMRGVRLREGPVSGPIR